MKSAYVTLGVPGNARLEDIQEAYQKALGYFSKEKLAADPSLFARLDEVKDAYKVLSDPDSRQAHDRKITGYVSPKVIRVVEPATAASTGSNFLLKFMVLMCIAILMTWGFVSHQHEEARKTREAKEAQELALKKEEAEKAAKAERDAADAQAKRDAANALAARNEQQLRTESSQVAQRAQIVEAAQQYVRDSRDRQDKAAAANERQQAANAAAQRAAADQRAIRNLCIINTGRPNC
ncbi:DnaJ domain-containing protein [Rhodoferax sp. GW822-FHT02A01]|uniref:DnaJ domain-containing protein n=1 Tax=Rhodoferax sp. GW822-FHT02A01 TaxID=3141537 RepID=UPI00315CBCFF